MMTRNSRVSPVELEMLPVYTDSEAYTAVGNLIVSGIRKLVVPTDQDTAIIAGPGPRFDGIICIHEALIED